jgi:uncharacterized protein
MDMPGQPPRMRVVRPPSVGSGLGRRRVGLGAVVLGLLVLVGLLRAVAGIYTDYLWFDRLSFTSVWSQLLTVKLVLGLGAALLAGMAVWLTIGFCAKVAPKSVRFAPNEELVAALREVLIARTRAIRIGVSVVMGFLVGPVMASHWNEWILFRNGGSVGKSVPRFGGDIGFYLFKLPFLSSIGSWLFALLIVLVLVALVFHTVFASLRFGMGIPKGTHAVRVHITVLLVLIALVKAVLYWFDRFALTTSTNGFVVGASYTDLVARRRGLELLVLVSLAAAVLLLVSLRRNDWLLQGVGAGVWLLVVIVATGIYPRVLARIVQSDEQNRERFSITNNIAATRTAFGLNGVATSVLPLGEESPNGAAAKKNATTTAAILANIRLWEPRSDIAANTFTSTQKVNDNFSLRNVDVDRYVVDGVPTPVIVSARELNLSPETRSSWLKSRLAYTHGFGLVVARGNRAGDAGLPSFVAKDLPPTGQLSVKEPRIYFGEQTDTYAVVGSKTPEVDFPGPDGAERTSSYKGKGGVAVGGPLRRLAFALRFGDANLIISKEVTSKAKLLYVRDVRARAEAVAPFLQFDNDPYPVFANNRIVWVLDAYTTSSHYPNSEYAPIDSVHPASGLYRKLNYVRNSVKVIVDAYDGSVRLYTTEQLASNATTPKTKTTKDVITKITGAAIAEVNGPNDPLISAYRKAFPKLFRSNAQLDRDYPELRSHLRYPQDLFRMQTAMIGRYHVEKSDQFYKNSSRWELSANPGDSPAVKKDEALTTNGLVVPVVSNAPLNMRPYYLQSALPGNEKAEFFLQSNLVTWSENRDQQNLRAVFVAQSDPANYGKLQILTAPTDRQVSGPALIGRSMSANADISAQESLLGTGGSLIRYGNMQVLPVNGSLLFVRPMFVEASNSNLPSLQFVAVSYRDKIGFDPTIEGALAKVGLDAQTGELSPPAGKGGSGTKPKPSGSTSAGGSATDAAVLGDVADLLNAAQKALDSGDLGTYQARVDDARKLLVERATGSASSTTSAGSGSSGSSGGSSSSGGSATSVPAPTTTVPPISSTPPPDSDNLPPADSVPTEKFKPKFLGATTTLKP